MLCVMVLLLGEAGRQGWRELPPKYSDLCSDHTSEWRPSIFTYSFSYVEFPPHPHTPSPPPISSLDVENAREPSKSAPLHRYCVEE